MRKQYKGWDHFIVFMVSEVLVYNGREGVTEQRHSSPSRERSDRKKSGQAYPVIYFF